MQSVELNPAADSLLPTAETTPPPATPEAAAKSVAETRNAEAEAARSRANLLMAEGKFTEARIALQDAEAILAGPKMSTMAASKEALNRFVSGVELRMRRKTETPAADKAKVEDSKMAEANTVKADAQAMAASAVDEAVKIVDRYSKIAAGVGLLPTFVLNFAGVLAVQITMVTKIARVFNLSQDKERVRGSILMLMGSVLPGTVGHGIGLAVASIPAMLTGTVLSFVLAPALAYALTSAVGKVFVMHFESGGTLLTFDPKVFRDHFVKAFKEAGGMSVDPPEKVATA